MVCWVQQAGGCSGGVRISGRSRVQRHRCRAERAADLAHDRGAHHPVVAVGVVAGDPAEFVAGGLGGLLVVGGGLVRGGVAGERSEFQQRPGRGRAVQVAVGDDGAVVGAAGAAVGGVQVLDQLGPGARGAGWPRLRRRGGRSRSRPGCRRAGCRAAGMRGQHRDQGAGRVGVAGARRSSAGPARARAGRAPRASWWRRRRSSRRTARCPGRGRRRSGAPRRPRGRRSRCCRAAAGGRRSPRRSSPPPARWWPACTRRGWTGLQQVVADRGEGLRGQAVGGVLGQGAGDQAEGPLGLPVGELVRAGLPVLGHAEPHLVGSGAGRSARRGPGSGARAADRPGHSSIPASRVRTRSCRCRTPIGSSASIRGATPEPSMISSSAAPAGCSPRRPEQRDRGRPHRPGPARRAGRRAAGSR